MPEAGRRTAGEGLTRRTSFTLLSQVSTAALTALITLYLARALDPGSFGDFALALSIVGLLIVPADLGVAGAAGRLMAENPTDRGHLRHVFRRALVQKLLIAGVLSIALFAAADPLARAFGSESLADALRGMSLALFGQSVFLLPDSAFLSLGRTKNRFLTILGESGVEAASTIGLVVAGLGAGGAALGRGVGYAFGALLGVAMVIRLIGGGRALLSREGETGRPPIFSFAVPLFIFALIYTAFVQIDALILGLMKDSEAVGIFQAPVRLVTFLGFLGLAVSGALTPRFATVEGRLGGGELLTGAVRGLILIQTASLGFVIAWATPLMDLILGPAYGGSAPVLRALSGFVVMIGVGPILTTAVHYGGELAVLRRRIPIVIVAIVVNIAMDLLLIPRIGVVGAAIGSSVGFLVYLVPHVLLVRRLVPGFDLRPAGLALLRGSVAATASGLTLAAIGTGELPVATILLGIPLGLIVYLLVLLLLREARPRDLRSAATALAGRLGT